MKLLVNLPVSILFLTQIRFFATAKECVIRESGACKVINLTQTYTTIQVNELGSAPPEGYQVKTTIEVNLLTNKYSFENNLPIEQKLPIGYELDNAAEVSIQIRGANDVGMIIGLGEKYYRMATLTHTKPYYEMKKHNHYSPILPRFPYILHFEITTNGIFSITADTNTEPFFKHDLGSDFVLKHFSLIGTANLIAFYDCSIENKPNCGTYYVDELYDCREWFHRKDAVWRDLSEFQETYDTTDIIFDEYIVVDTKRSASMYFFDADIEFVDGDVISIEFLVDAIEVRTTFNKRKIRKSVRTEKWFEQPASPYFVRVLISNSTDNNSLNITNIRGDTIISMNLCGRFRSLTHVEIDGPSLYLDCLRPDDKYNNTFSQRSRKTDISGTEGNTVYSEDGFNFTKLFLDIRDYSSEGTPFVLYEYDFGFSKDDWCEEEPHPKVFLKSKTNISGTVAHTEQQMHEVNASIVNYYNNNNYNYYFNNINVTEFPKFLNKN